MTIEETINSLHDTQQLEITESVINTQCRNYGVDCTVAVFDGFIVLTTDNGLEAHLSYHSHNVDHTNGEFSISLQVLKVRPFYYAMALPLISTRFSFLNYQG